MEECRHLSIYVIEGVYLDTALMLAELGPPKHGQTQVDGRGIESIYTATEFEDIVIRLLLASATRKYANSSKMRLSRFWLAFARLLLVTCLPKAEVVALAAVSLDDDNQITQTLPIGQLSEHHHQRLIPASEVFHIAVAIV